MQICRRVFLKNIAEIGVTALALPLIVKCSTEDDPAGTLTGGGDCQNNGTNTSISSNHGHSLTVPIANIYPGDTNQVYDIQGSADHTHSVSITAADFTTLKNSGTLVVTSSSAGHTHTVTISCA